MKPCVVFALAVCAGVAVGCAGPPPTAPPYHSAKELRDAVKAVLGVQDTNAFWRLTCWTNVSPEDERSHKKASLNANFKQTPQDTVSYGGFSIKSVEKGFGNPTPIGPKGLLAYNIPVTGVITFT